MGNRRLRIALIASFLCVLVGGFQNCTRSRFIGDEPGAPRNTGNGRTYDGKTFANFDAACRDGDATARVRVDSDTQAVLLRDNCADLIPGTVLNGTQFTVDAANPNQIVVDGRIFTRELTGVALTSKIRVDSSYAGSPTFHAQLPEIRDGDLIVCVTTIVRPHSGLSVAAFSDSAGNSYQKILGPISGPRTDLGYTVEVWYAQNARAGANVTISATYAGTFDSIDSHALSCLAYSGLAEQGALDQVVYGFADAGGNLTLQTAMPSQDKELYLSLYAGNTSVESDHPELATVLKSPFQANQDIISEYQANRARVFQTTNNWADPNKGIGILLTFKAL